MKPVSQRELDEKQERVYQYARAIIQPHRVTDELTLCWPYHLEYAQRLAQALGPRNERGFRSLYRRWKQLCADADVAYQEYIEAFESVNREPEREIIVEQCWCIGCEARRKNES